MPIDLIAEAKARAVNRQGPKRRLTAALEAAPADLRDACEALIAEARAGGVQMTIAAEILTEMLAAHIDDDQRISAEQVRRHEATK